MDAEQRRRHYVSQLEAVVRQMLRPLKGVPFNLVIEAMTGDRVLDFDLRNGPQRRIFDVLVAASRKMYRLEKLSLDVKYEFNSDNHRLYSDKEGARLLYVETDLLR